MFLLSNELEEVEEYSFLDLGEELEGQYVKILKEVEELFYLQEEVEVQEEDFEVSLLRS